MHSCWKPAGAEAKKSKMRHHRTKPSNRF
jgi:hypothetical protein